MNNLLENPQLLDLKPLQTNSWAVVWHLYEKRNRKETRNKHSDLGQPNERWPRHSVIKSSKSEKRTKVTFLGIWKGWDGVLLPLNWINKWRPLIEAFSLGGGQTAELILILDRNELKMK